MNLDDLSTRYQRFEMSMWMYGSSCFCTAIACQEGYFLHLMKYIMLLMWQVGIFLFVTVLQNLSHMELPRTQIFIVQHSCRISSAGYLNYCCPVRVEHTGTPLVDFFLSGRLRRYVPPKLRLTQDLHVAHPRRRRASRHQFLPEFCSWFRQFQFDRLLNQWLYSYSSQI
jgi:hypothetical protein